MGNEIFGRWDTGLKSRVVKVDELVVELAGDVSQQTVKLLDIDHHTCVGIALAAHGHAEPIVVAMSVRTDAFAKDVEVLFVREGGVPVPMRSLKFHRSSEIVHCFPGVWIRS